MSTTLLLASGDSTAELVTLESQIAYMTGLRFRSSHITNGSYSPQRGSQNPLHGESGRRRMVSEIPISGIALNPVRALSPKPLENCSPKTRGLDPTPRP